MGFSQRCRGAYGDEVEDGSIPLRNSAADLDALIPVAERIAAHVTDLSTRSTDGGHSTIVGMAGGVAVGKSTAAASLRTVLVERMGLECAIVSSDGFLLPNETLLEHGIFHRKGFPESYDHAAIDRFVAAIRQREFPVTVPLYDHLIHDVLHESAAIGLSPVVLFEGVNTLGFASSFDLSIYIDAAESSMRSWYLERVLELRRRSADEPSAFFAGFAGLSDEEFASRAESIWEAVNLPNLIEHIEPTRAKADIIIGKAPDHSIESVVIR
jgi:type I pantothenate kinase